MCTEFLNMKTLFIAIGLLIGLFVGTLWIAHNAEAATPPSTVPQGGTGWGALDLGYILFGQGNTLPGSLRLGTSTNLRFSTSTGNLNFKYGSTTAFSVSGTTYLQGLLTSSYTGANILPYASTTALTVTNTASTSKLFADGLASCAGATNALTWAAGVFGCNSISAGGTFPFTPANYGGVAVNSTSTPLWLTTGLPSLIATSTFATYASSTNLTNSSNTWLTTMTSALLLTGSDGLVAEYSGTSCTNQFTRSISALGVATCATVGAADVALANLTATNGTLTFSGTYDGSTARTIGLNLANANVWTALQIFNANASSTLTSASQAWFGGTATSTIDTRGYYGFGTTSPFSALTLDRIPGSTAAATSSITVTEYQPGTTTASTIDARDSNSILWRIGASATTLTLTGFVPGKQLVVTVCNSDTAAGAITWATSPANMLRWAGGSVPSQTTTAKKCDVWSFRGTNGTTTPIIVGAQTAGF